MTQFASTGSESQGITGNHGELWGIAATRMWDIFGNGLLGKDLLETVNPQFQSCFPTAGPQDQPSPRSGDVCRGSRMEPAESAIPASLHPRIPGMFTSVHWLWEMKKTRAKGSERPLLSAANKLLAWYMWARSWKTCFSGRERGWDGLGQSPGTCPREVSGACFCSQVKDLSSKRESRMDVDFFGVLFVACTMSAVNRIGMRGHNSHPPALLGQLD